VSAEVMAGTKVAIFEADGTMEFARMYVMRPDGTAAGQFVALAKDVRGLTPLQLKDKFDLPDLPTHVATALPPAGTRIASGIVEKGNFGGKGGGTQFYFMEPVNKKWFKDGNSI
jgi:filamentous hemagglutinin